jgi:hypothetical protein
MHSLREATAKAHRHMDGPRGLNGKQEAEPPTRITRKGKIDPKPALTIELKGLAKHPFEDVQGWVLRLCSLSRVHRSKSA